MRFNFIRNRYVGVTAFFVGLSFLTLTYISIKIIAPDVRTDATTQTVEQSSGPHTASMSSDSVVSIDITPTETQSVYSTTSELTVSNTCNAGVMITMGTSGDNNSLIRSSTNDDVVTKTIPATAGTSLDDTSWGYSLNSGNTWAAVPASNNATAQIYDGSTVASNSPVQVMFGIKIDNTLPSGAYMNDIIYTLVPKDGCLMYQITWDLNGGAAKAGTSYPTSLYFDATLDLTELIPTREGYSFTGWSNGVDEFDGTETSANINPDEAQTLTMTAQWMPTMQSFKCSSISPGDEIVLMDTRDKNTYKVRKFADGNCWMIENLRLIDKTISSEDSNLPLGVTYIVPESDLESSFTYSSTDSAYLDDTYGGYYSFYTATAGSVLTTSAAGNASYDICPRGWRLPIGGNDGGEFGQIVSDLNYGRLTMNLSGLAYYGSIEEQGSRGYIWSSTIYTTDMAYDLWMDTRLARTSYSSMIEGRSIYCIANQDTMQSFKISSLSNVGDEKRLVDERDGKIYTVKKLSDGNVWMTENLRIVDKTITSADSNISSDFTIPASSATSFSSQDTNEVFVDSSNGGYYSFYTATAGTGGSSLSSGDVLNDICPKGWRLPTGGESSEFQTLYNNYNSSTLMQGDPRFTLSGYMGDGIIHNHSSLGYYWSSTVQNSSNAYSLLLDSSGVNPAGTSNKNRGHAIRCMAQPTMQTFDATTLRDVGDEIRLTDERDGKIYTVKKLSDGNVWMTENLRIVNKTISYLDSNLPIGETYDIPASDPTSFDSTYNKSSVYTDDTYGGYYNFYTATAGWGTNNVANGNAPKDICPKGWRLPTGGANGEFSGLYNQYGSLELMQGVPAITLSGYISNSGSISNQGTRGRYWSSTVSDAENAYRLRIDTGDGVMPESAANKNNGFSIRCVAIDDTMQDFNKSTLTATGNAVRLIDSRDGNIYTVKKLSDGNVWMTENLSLIDKTITSEDSNLPSGETYTIPKSSTYRFVSYNTNNAYVDRRYGGYYTFYTATAGWGTGSLGSNSNVVSSGSSPKDICPKGWRIPTKSESETLMNKYNSPELIMGEPNIYPAGYVHNASHSYTWYGYYWTSTVADNRYANTLAMSQTHKALAIYSTTEKYLGESVRCIAK